MRSFEFARKIEEGKVVAEKAFENARLPEYKTRHSAGADFFCAEAVVIPSVWTGVFKALGSFLVGGLADQHLVDFFKPTLVHTGVKAHMEEDEGLFLYNRSSNPGKIGLILANGVGVVDADYADNPDNDGEIMFAFYNLKPWPVRIEEGQSVGQGVFKKFLRPTEGLIVSEDNRVGGFGSTGK